MLHKWMILGMLSWATALAQGSGSIALPPSAAGIDSEPFRVTRTVTGTIRSLSEAGVLVIEDEKKKTLQELKLSPKVRIVSTNRKQKLAASDLAAGQYARVTYAPDGSVALEIRLLTAKSEPGDKKS